MMLHDAGMPHIEASRLYDFGIETPEQLRAWVATTPNWRDRLGRVVTVAVERFLAETPAP